MKVIILLIFLLNPIDGEMGSLLLSYCFLVTKIDIYIELT